MGTEEYAFLSFFDQALAAMGLPSHPSLGQEVFYI